jgi:hypothetical protein
MGLFKRLRLKARYTQRLGAYVRARQQGMTDEQARLQVDQVYPPTPDDLRYEEERRKASRRN